MRFAGGYSDQRQAIGDPSEYSPVSPCLSWLLRDVSDLSQGELESIILLVQSTASNCPRHRCSAGTLLKVCYTSSRQSFCKLYFRQINIIHNSFFHSPIVHCVGRKKSGRKIITKLEGYAMCECVVVRPLLNINI